MFKVNKKYWVVWQRHVIGQGNQLSDYFLKIHSLKMINSHPLFFFQGSRKERVKFYTERERVRKGGYLQAPCQGRMWQKVINSRNSSKYRWVEPKNSSCHTGNNPDSHCPIVLIDLNGIEVNERGIALGVLTPQTELSNYFKP